MTIRSSGFETSEIYIWLWQMIIIGFKLIGFNVKMAYLLSLLVQTGYTMFKTTRSSPSQIYKGQFDKNNIPINISVSERFRERVSIIINLFKPSYNQCFYAVYTTILNAQANIAAIQNMEYFNNLTPRNDWGYITDVSKYHTGGIWSMD